MRTIYHQPVGAPRPKRGDLVQSNIGDRKRERTWIILSVHTLPTRFCDHMGITAQRTRIWAERWWEIEPELRNRLYRNAERHGGQRVHPHYRFPTKEKLTFEEHMRRGSTPQ